MPVKRHPLSFWGRNSLWDSPTSWRRSTSCQTSCSLLPQSKWCRDGELFVQEMAYWFLLAWVLSAGWYVALSRGQVLLQSQRLLFTTNWGGWSALISYITLWITTKPCDRVVLFPTCSERRMGEWLWAVNFSPVSPSQTHVTCVFLTELFLLPSWTFTSFRLTLLCLLCFSLYVYGFVFCFFQVLSEFNGDPWLPRHESRWPQSACRVRL